MAGGFRDEPDGSLPLFAVGSRVAGYRVEKRIGAGGMAVVFRAWDERLDRWVALKVLAPALAADEVFRRRFLREARAAAAVDDPHIIPVFEAGEAGGALFIAMRYVPGGDARSLIRRAGRLSWQRAAAVVSSVASALDTAHGAGLVHRDVKPANILVDVRPGRPDHVYLSDFGLCRGAPFWSGPSGQGQFLGTLGYAAPEQLAGKPADGRVDQYSLACSAFELLSGEQPFPRDDPGAVIWAHMSQPPPLITSQRPELPAAVNDVLARALAKEPGDRYASCRDFASALRTALETAPSDGAAVTDLQADRWPDETTWPSVPGPEQAERVCAGAPAATRPRGRFRLSVPVAALAAVLSVFGALAQFNPFGSAANIPVDVPARVPITATSNLLGVYVPGRPAYRSVRRFTAAAGREPAFVEYVTRWGEPFAISSAWTLHRHGSMPLVQIEPASVSMARVAAGAYDGYLRAYADSVRDFGHQVVIGFGREMNSTRYSWGYTHTLAAAFAAAWRHIVTVFRDQGADNVTWLWTIDTDQPGTGPIRSWWPGPSYVTWIGIDGFYTRPSDTFNSVFGRTIDQVRVLASNPILLAETGVARSADQAAGIRNLFTGVARYRMLGLVWAGNHEDGLSPAAGQAFRHAASRLTTLRG